MPYKEAGFWVCLTIFGTGLYFMFEQLDQTRMYFAVLLIFVGFIGMAWLVFQHHYPDKKLPSNGIWVWLALVLTWGFLGYAINADPAAVPHSEPSPAEISQTALGVNKNVADHYIAVTATVVGSPTAAKYGKDNSIFIFCLAGDSKIDPGADSAIDRSKPFDLAQRPVNIEVALGSANTNRILKAGLIDIYLLMIPKNVDQSTLLTFNDIYSHGGKLLSHTAMGESPAQLAKDLNSK